MAKTVGTIGSGITEQAILKLDVAEGDLAMIVRAANHTMAMETFSTASKVISYTAKNVLEAHNLPSDPRGIYVLRGSEWGQIEGKASRPGNYQSFLAVFVRLGIPPDHAAGSAAQALVLIEQIRGKSNNPDEALALAIKLGEITEQAKFKAAWEDDALRGAAIQQAAEKGDLMANGSRELRQNRAEAIRQQVEAEIKRGLKRTAAYKKVAKTIGKAPKTVERIYTKKTRDDSRSRP